MKHFYLFLLTFILAPIMLSAQTDAEYLKQALINTYTKSELVNSLYDYDYRNGLSSIGGFIKEGNYITFNLYLSSSGEYLFVGGGDDDVKDLDIYVYDKDGNIVSKDNEDDANPMVNFSPSSSGVYEIKLKLISCDANGSFCAMNFMLKNGVKPATDKFDQGINKMVKVVNYIDDQKGTKFLDREGEICYYGFTFSSDDKESQINGIDLQGDQDYFMLAVGDDGVYNIDLVLMDSDGNKLDSDTDDDATPIVTHNSSSLKENLSLKVKDIDSKTKSYIITVVLED